MASQYEISRGEQIVDVRPWTSRAAESLSNPINLVCVCAAIILLTLIIPVLLPLTITLFLVVVIASKNVSALLPLRYPPEAIDPETKTPGAGIWFLGNMEYDKKKNRRLPLESAADRFKEVWLADDDLRKHLLILGSTGSGKSELLKGIFFCSLCWGSGFFVADGKADNKLPLDTFNMARFFGRDDDLLALNFLLAGKTPAQVRNARSRRTNKTNPFSTADADTIVQMGANLLPKVDGDAKNWQEKALNCWRGLVPALCWLRDNEAMEISVTSFVDYLALPKLEELYARGHVLAQLNGGVWNEGFVGLKAYLEVGLPGFKIDRCLRKHNILPAQARPAMGAGGKQEPTDQDSNTYDQHGYRATQLNPALNLLDKTYGHIFQDKFSEIDMVDVTLNNRILVLLIPSLEKSAQEAESLGKLTVACLRVMMGKNLGAEIEGKRERILESKATEARYPYVVALDELGYYFADGIAVMFAQARSLGFAMIAAAQDIEKLTEGSRAAEAGAMLANQVTKIFMRIDDANKTNEMIQKYLGKVNVALKETYEYRSSTGFKRMPEVKLQEIPVATLQNLQSLGAGKAIINTMGQTFKIASFYVGSFLLKYPTQTFHINRFLQVRGLTDKEIREGLDTEDGYEMISLPIDVLNDKQVKGAQMKSYLTREDPLPDLRAVADSAAYAAKHDKAVGMLNALALAATNLPANVVGSQRAIVLYRIARDYVLANRSTQVTKGSSRAGADVMKDNTQASLHPGAGVTVVDEAFVTPGQAAAAAVTRPQTAEEFATQLVLENTAVTGESIEHGSGTGTGANSVASPHDDDPFAFINESKPLERKAASALVMAAPGVSPSSGLVDMGLAGVADILKPAPLPAEAALEAARDGPALPQRLAEVVAAVVAAGEPLDFSFAGLSPRNESTEQAAADAQWIGKALAQAATGLASKGETVVGFTEKTKESFVRLETALGNSEPTQAAAAIEQLVAQQTTPTPLDPTATGADFGDINDLMNEVEASINS